jgi:hypothetical protein
MDSAELVRFAGSVLVGASPAMVLGTQLVVTGLAASGVHRLLAPPQVGL